MTAHVTSVVVTAFCNHPKLSLHTSVTTSRVICLYSAKCQNTLFSTLQLLLIEDNVVLVFMSLQKIIDVMSQSLIISHVCSDVFVIHTLIFSVYVMWLASRWLQSCVASACEGRGGKEGAVEKCSTCRGTGVQIRVQQLGPGFIQQMQSVCSECEGQGERINPKDRCKDCQGRKITRERKVLEVHIDKGTDGIVEHILACLSLWSQLKCYCHRSTADDIAWIVM